MTPPGPIFELQMKLAYGKNLKFYIKSWETLDICAIQDAIGAAMAHMGCAIPKKCLKENANGASCAIVASERRDNVAFSLEAAFPAGNRQRKKEIREELEEARLALQDFSSELASLDSQLAPYWRDDRIIRDAILATHGRRSDGAVILDISQARERKAMFKQLDRLTEEWGPVKVARSEMNARVRGLERQIREFERAISKETQKGAKNGKRSQSSS